MKTEDTIYNANEATTLGGAQDNTKESKPESASKRNSTWKEVAIGGGTGILFGAATTFFTSAAGGNDAPQRPPQVDEHIPVASCVDDDMSFSQAFAAARAEVGPGGVFQWHGHLYNTYTAEEWNQLSAEERAEYDSHFDWAASTDSASDDSIQADVDIASKDIAIATCVDDDMSFSQAFAAARAEVGSGGVFQWHGNLYNTFTAEEWGHMSAGERAEFSTELSSTPIPMQDSHHSSNGYNTGYQSHNDSSIEVIQYETLTTEDGTPMDVALVNIQGQEAYLFDFNRDGIIDVMGADINGDGQVDYEEMIDVSNENMAMVTPEDNTTIVNPPIDEPQVAVLGYETVTNDDGSQMDIAMINIEGHDAAVIDANMDGRADYIAVDTDGDSQVDEGEIVDVSHENIAMQDFQQAADMNQNNYLAMGGEGPDYVNDANVDGYLA